MIETYWNILDIPLETRLKVNENGSVVIPASFRKALGIGDEIVLRMEDDELRITTMKRRIERAPAPGPGPISNRASRWSMS